MYKRFQALPVVWRIAVVMVALIVAGVVFNLVLRIVAALIPLAITATIIVAALWVFDKLRSP